MQENSHRDHNVRISGRGLEVVIDEVRLGRRGTGRQLIDEDGPMFHDDGDPMIDETKDGYSVYHVSSDAHTKKASGRCIFPHTAQRWQLSSDRLIVRAGDFIEERGSYGRVLTAGVVAYDVIWVGGSTQRYKQGQRDLRIVGGLELDKSTRDHLLKESADAIRERATGARIRRGTVSPR
jgi:hypothetical protein